MQKLLYTDIGPNGTPYKKGDWKDFAIQNEKEIKGFFGDYRFLSNFWPAHVTLDGIEYKSTELAYQAAKWRPEHRQYFQTCTELESVDYNRTHIPDGYTNEGWRAKKVDTMKNLLEQKFDQKLNPQLHEKLCSTGDKHLEEMNWWADRFWGTDQDGSGENMLGKLLIEIRDKTC